jgi:hypothetical protein
MAPPLLRFQTKDSVCGIFEGAQIRREIGFDSGNGIPLHVRWNGSIRNTLYAFIPKITGFSQSN